MEKITQMLQDEKLVNTAFKTEELSISAQTIHSMQEALFQAIFNGGMDVDVYKMAFSNFGELTYKMAEEVEALKEMLFAEVNKQVDVSE
ncbi:hypothetical protein M2140_000175 [Clostridiales Family XIII bacterium PM5-7]